MIESNRSLLLRVLAHGTLGCVVFVLILILGRLVAVIVRLVRTRPLPIGWLIVCWRGSLQLLRCLRCVALILVGRTADRSRGLVLLVVRLHLRVRRPATVVLWRSVSRGPTAIRLWRGIRIWPCAGVLRLIAALE